MLRDLSTKDMLQEWIDAANTFCNARTPNYGRFAGFTREVCWQYADRHAGESKFFANLVEAGQSMAEHVAKATPNSRRDVLDRALLSSWWFVMDVGTCVENVASRCTREALISAAEEAELVADIRKTVSRRQAALRRKSPVIPLP